MCSAMTSMNMAISKQQQILETLLKLQEKTSSEAEDLERIRLDTEERSATRSMVETARRDAEQESMKAQNDKVIRTMMARLESFESIIRSDRGDRRDTPETVPQTFHLGTPDKTGSVKEVDSMKASLATPGIEGSAESASSASPPEVKEYIRLLEQNAMAPMEIMSKALREYRDVDTEDWARHFPAGYRERMAPSWLAEVFSTGKTAKQWSKEWLTVHEAGDSQEARDLLPTKATLDTIFLQDKTPSAINMVSTEKLVRKAYGIVQGYKEVKKKSDWQRPTGGSKSWKTQVDHEAWRRYDPSYEEKEHLFINRRVEDEVRSEMDRDAALLKAKSKLAAGQAAASKT